MEEFPIFDIGLNNGPLFNIGIGDNFLQIIFIASLICFSIFTIIMFVHWKKYAPNPLKIFTYSVVYLAASLAMIIAQMSLLSLY